MNRGRSPRTPGSSGRGGRSQRPRGYSDRPRSYVGDGRPSVDDSCSGDGNSRTTGRSSQNKPESNSRYFKHARGTYVPKRPLTSGNVELPELEALKQKQELADSESTPVSVHKSDSPLFLDKGKVKIEELPELGTLKQKQELADSESTPVSVHKSDSPSFLDKGKAKIEELPELGALKQKQELADSESTPVTVHKSDSPSFSDKGKVKIEEFPSAIPHDLSPKLNTSSIGKSKQPDKDKGGILCKFSQENSSGKTAHVVDSFVSEHLDMGKIQVEESLSATLKPFGTQHSPSQENSPEKTLASADPGGSELPAVVKPYDICLVETGTPVMLKPSLLVKNREKRLENNRALEGQNRRILRSGMVILKNYLSLSCQIKIVKKCRELGLGPGGFYQPGYRDGAELHLKMMCLGKNWDPETSKYDDHRSVDGAKPPAIPHEFCQLVGKAIKDSQALIQGNSNARNVEEILPSISPDICIVNFYTATGRLGLHQDRDESQESLRGGLPVVSFSVGDSAEFLYGDQRDIDKADKIILESGDVLIFGGKSRHIFHGVTAIIRDTGPKALLEETNLRSGRLNLTFRKY
ncbi:hypothetical protein SLE2022_385710 [Rubroshorea leprosula]